MRYNFRYVSHVSQQNVSSNIKNAYARNKRYKINVCNNAIGDRRMYVSMDRSSSIRFDIAPMQMFIGFSCRWHVLMERLAWYTIRKCKVQMKSLNLHLLLRHSYKRNADLSSLKILPHISGVVFIFSTKKFWIYFISRKVIEL